MSFPKQPAVPRTMYLREMAGTSMPKAEAISIWSAAMNDVRLGRRSAHREVRPRSAQLIADYETRNARAWTEYVDEMAQWKVRDPAGYAARDSAEENRTELKRKREADNVAAEASAAVAAAALQAERVLAAGGPARASVERAKCEYIENKCKSAKVEKALIDVMVLLVARRDAAGDATSAARGTYAHAKGKWDELAPLGRISAAHQAESDEAYRRADNVRSITYLVGDAARCSGQAVEAEETARIWRELDFDGNQVSPDTGRWGVEHTAQDVQRHFLALAKEHREKACARETEIQATVAGFVAKKRAILALKTRPAPATIHDDRTPEGILLAADVSEAELAFESAQSVYKTLYAACETATANLDRFRRVQKQRKGE
jgi:hypothetical protein